MRSFRIQALFTGTIPFSDASIWNQLWFCCCIFGVVQDTATDLFPNKTDLLLNSESEKVT